MFRSRSVNVTPLVWLFGILMPASLLLASLSRLFFAWVNQEQFSSLSNLSWWAAMLHGIRFDLATFAYLNAVLILAAIFLPALFRFTLYRRSFITLAVAANALLTTVGLIDALYFSYSGRRSGVYVFGLLDDLLQQSGHLIVTFGGYLLVILLLLALFSYPMLRSWPKRTFTLRWYVYVPVAFITIVLTVLAGRGGLDSKPLKAAHAFTWPEPAAGNLVLNTTFAMQASMRDGLPQISYFSSDDLALEAWSPESSCPVSQQPAAKRKDNVVILLVESLGYELFQRANGERSYAPFIESLAEQGLLFEHGLANGRRSIDVVPAVLGGIPSLMDSPFANSKYQTNDVVGLGTLLTEQGYNTAFFHGTKNGSMYIDAMAQRFGFKQYYGLNEYPDPSHKDGAWGIYDRPFLDFTARELTKLGSPFAIGIKTLSSHNPYVIEPELSAQFAHAPSPFLRSMLYADYSVEQFFEQAKQQPWYQDTLFVITGDHAIPGHETLGLYDDLAGRYRVPILFYHPGGALPAQASQQLAQHVDIPQSVLGFLGYLGNAQQLTAFGRNLFCEQPQANGQMVVRENGGYYLIDEQLQARPSNALAEPQKLAALQGYVQLFNNGMERDLLRRDRVVVR